MKKRGREESLRQQNRAEERNRRFRARLARRSKRRGRLGRVYKRIALSPRMLRAREIKLGETFSVIRDPESAVNEMGRLFVMAGKEGWPISIDTKSVKNITIDALLYLLAITNALKSMAIDFDIRGELPRDPVARKLFIDSGFLNYAKPGSAEIKRQGDCVQIDCGQNVDPLIARSLCVFTMEKLGLARTKTRSLYDIVIEIITNTIQHAYDRSPEHDKWFAYARYVEEDDAVEYSILDSGLGIPFTVKKTLREKLEGVVEKFGVKLWAHDSGDSALIQSALDGKLRTETGLAYRGKGMPIIKKYQEDGYISDLTIVSNRGYLAYGREARSLPVGFLGTLYFWRIKRAN